MRRWGSAWDSSWRTPTTDRGVFGPRDLVEARPPSRAIDVAESGWIEAGADPRAIPEALRWELVMDQSSARYHPGRTLPASLLRGATMRLPWILIVAGFAPGCRAREGSSEDRLAEAERLWAVQESAGVFWDLSSLAEAPSIDVRTTHGRYWIDGEESKRAGRVVRVGPDPEIGGEGVEHVGVHSNTDSGLSSELFAWLDGLDLRRDLVVVQFATDVRGAARDRLMAWALATFDEAGFRRIVFMGNNNITGPYMLREHALAR